MNDGSADETVIRSSCSDDRFLTKLGHFGLLGRAEDDDGLNVVLRAEFFDVGTPTIRVQRAKGYSSRPPHAGV